MNIIVDTNVLVKAILLDDEILKTILQEEELYFPDLVFSELGNVYLQYIKQKVYEYEYAIQKLGISFQLVSTVLDWRQYGKEVLDLSLKHQLSFYDAIYLFLSIHNNYPIVTLDKKLLKAAKSEDTSYPL